MDDNSTFYDEYAPIPTEECTRFIKAKEKLNLFDLEREDIISLDAAFYNFEQLFIDEILSKKYVEMFLKLQNKEPNDRIIEWVYCIEDPYMIEHYLFGEYWDDAIN